MLEEDPSVIDDDMAATMMMMVSIIPLGIDKPKGQAHIHALSH